MDELAARVRREQERYDEQSMAAGQAKLGKILHHANNGPSRDRRDRVIYDQARRFVEGDVLEFGSQAWGGVFGRDRLQPRRLVCINISQIELDAGAQAAQHQGFRASFKLMDAHRLEFPDRSFDFVYGVAILHHLDFKRSIKEIWRVLRPGGEIMFVEPLRMNPIAQLVRLATPNARTADELPLGWRELTLVDRYFETRHHYSDLFTVPAAMISRFIWRNPANPLTRIADSVDYGLVSMVPRIGLIYRTVTLLGRKRAVVKT